MSSCCTLLQWEDKIVDRRILTDYFVCDLDACRGECCKAGEEGAPLTTEEMGGLCDTLPSLRPYLPPAHFDLLEEKGVGVRDGAGGWMTPCLSSTASCAFSFVEKGCCLCALERAQREGIHTPEGRDVAPKPLSCALYPIRLRRAGVFTQLRYDEWDICAPARAKGERERVHVYEFLRTPLLRAFGHTFYDWLCEMQRKISS